MLNQLKMLLAAMELSPLQRHYFLCHPDTLEWLKSQFNGKHAPSLRHEIHPFTGVEIRTSTYCPRFVEHRWWQFPEDRFWEYEKKDEEWAIPLGFGQWVTYITDEPYIMAVVEPRFQLKNIFPPRFDWRIGGVSCTA
jgi:hypothetical protein